MSATRIAVLNAKQVKSRLASRLPSWTRVNGCIERTYKTDGWPHTLMLVNAIGYLCEAACHHPDLRVSYAQVTVMLSTHQPPGITGKDLELAELIEQHVLWLPTGGTGGALEGYEKGFGKPWVK